MVPMGAQPAQSGRSILRRAGPPCQYVGGRAVVEGDDPARPEQPVGLSHPAAGNSLDRHSRAHRDLGQTGNKLRRRRYRHQREAARGCIVNGDAKLPPAVLSPLNHIEGKVVQQLVGHHHTGRRAVRESVAHTGCTGDHRMVGVQGPLGRGHVHQHQPQRARSHAARLCGQHRAGQRPRSRPPVDHRERIGLAQFLPPCVQGPGQDCAKQRPDLRRGQEMARTAPGAPPAGPHIEAAVAVVQAGLHKLRHRDRSPLLDPASDPLPQPLIAASDGLLGRGPGSQISHASTLRAIVGGFGFAGWPASASQPARAVTRLTSVKWPTHWGRMPKARVTAPVRIRAAETEVGILMGDVVSKPASVGGVSTHM